MKLIPNWMLKIAMPTFIAGAMMTLPALHGGQDSGGSSQPHFPGEAPGEAQSILQRLEGPISAVDPKAMTLTVKLAEGPRTFKVTSKTKFTRGGAPASLSAAVVGTMVEIIIKMEHGQSEAVSVDIKAR
jgi:hypothetical protein